ncbi:hypothetical protein R1flu_029318 [Riccia fluitans]|uniref:Uncharacterized protein n=1 Tax=Riccia fluitans TaxID=41844 RepID=A0ABD1XP63_9MARC
MAWSRMDPLPESLMETVYAARRLGKQDPPSTPCTVFSPMSPLLAEAPFLTCKLPGSKMEVQPVYRLASWPTPRALFLEPSTQENSQNAGTSSLGIEAELANNNLPPITDMVVTTENRGIYQDKQESRHERETLAGRQLSDTDTTQMSHGMATSDNLHSLAGEFGRPIQDLVYRPNSKKGWIENSFNLRENTEEWRASHKPP